MGKIGLRDIAAIFAVWHGEPVHRYPEGVGVARAERYAHLLRALKPADNEIISTSRANFLPLSVSDLHP